MTNPRPLDFSAFGETEVLPLNRIQKFAAQALTRSWTNLPHVTHHDEADITALETAREELNNGAPEPRVSPLAYVLQATALTLKSHPKLNASFDADAQTVVLKKYYNLGVAIDTANGLLVGIVYGCDRKSVREIATEIAQLSTKAREKGLSIQEMSGGSFTVSSLGGIGGAAFTPIINMPEVAILGVGKAQWKPLRGEHDRIDWRLMLPLSLSYDHRVVNGADAARFVRALGELLAAPRTIS
jgi:pyruvate dehydrogenase E2 component (dihydrolipoamide acetyltransferase)